MRIGFVGLSTPLCYDYTTEATRAPSDLSTSPNPILDSPFGLMLLYDELWFLCRSLCPENMRQLDFVRFLDEERMLPEVDDLDLSVLEKDKAADLDELLRRSRGTAGFDHAVRALRMDWDPGPDNHTHLLRIGPLEVAANSGDARLILLDLELVHRLDQPSVELIGNTLGQEALDETAAVPPEALAHALVIDRIPNYQARQGPYHPVIAEARNDRFLADFRRWATELSPVTPAEELGAKKAAVEEMLARAQAELFLAHLDSRATYLSIGKTVVTSIADALVPMVGAASQVAADVRQDRRVASDRWQGFLVSLDQAARRIDG